MAASITSSVSSSSWRTRLGKAPIAFILGNEGGDMDSVVSAFCMSNLIMTATSKQHFSRLTAASSSTSHSNVSASSAQQLWLRPLQNHTCIPVCNFSRKELKLRRDITFAFQKAQIDIMSSLSFSDDFPELLSDPSSVKDLHPQDCVILVDHNIPCPSQQHLCPFVKGIVDHHQLPPTPLIVEPWKKPSFSSSSSSSQSQSQENEKDQQQEGKEKEQQEGPILEMIEKIGSAASHVTDLYHRLMLPMSPGLAKLLLAPVLLDTANFSERAKKATDGDRVAKKFLTRIISTYQSFDHGGGNDDDFRFKFSNDDCNAYHKELEIARESYDGLEISEALRKDAKMFVFELPNGQKQLPIPISSWGEHLNHCVLKRFELDDLVKNLEQYTKDRNGEGAIALFHKKGERHLIYFAQTKRCQKALGDFFENASLVENKEKPFYCSLTKSEKTNINLDRAGVFQFDDATISRKGFTPKLEKFFYQWNF